MGRCGEAHRARNQNPLTPIQLSAERLRRKYANEIRAILKYFKSVRIRSFVMSRTLGAWWTEFSSFARMPTAVMKEHELRELCRQTVFMQATGRTDIKYVQELPLQKVYAECDGRQLAQAITNLLKNAAGAIDARSSP